MTFIVFVYVDNGADGYLVHISSFNTV